MVSCPGRPAAWLRAGLAAMFALGASASALAQDAEAPDMPLDLTPHASTPPAALPTFIPRPPVRPRNLGKTPKPAKDSSSDNSAAPLPATDSAAPAHAPVKAPAAPAPSGAAAPELSPAEIVARANAYFESARIMSADFVQIAPDGSRSEGKLSIARPGHMLFHYNPPERLEIIADGRSVAVRDQKLGTQDLYFIGQTPLKFLLSDHIDLARDTKVKRAEIDEHSATVEIEDKATFGGTSDVTLVFDSESFALKQWTVLDPQGFQTVVSLFDIDLVTPPDPSLFKIDESAPSGAANVKQ